ncbi:hypothetical protein EIP86_008100 [Pleurotus ostreatoroseus]|nr:hypothetical protein EIP86_008100 [Pleurotus ostreatoroseus]
MENDSDDQPLSRKVMQKSPSDYIKEEPPDACKLNSSGHISSSHSVLGEADKLLSGTMHPITKPSCHSLSKGLASHAEHRESSRPATPTSVQTPILRTDTVETSFGLASPKEDFKPMSPRATVTAQTETSCPKLKRPAQGILRTPVTAKKPRLSGIETNRMPSGKSLDSQQARRSMHSIQLATPNSPISKRHLPSSLVHTTNDKELSPLPVPAFVPSRASRSASRIPSPSPSPSGIEQIPSTEPNTQLRTPAGSLPTTPCIQRLPSLSPRPSPRPSPAPPSVTPPTPSATPAPDPVPFDAQILLGCAIREAALAVTSYVQAHPCEDFGLRLKVLDLNTRLGELSRLLKLRSSVDEHTAEEAILEELVEIAEKAVVEHLAEQGCSDVRLKVKIMDLGTRLDMR